MGDVIDFKKRLEETKINVEIEDNSQLLLELAIVTIWADVGGDKLKSFFEEEDELAYLLLFLQFSGTCFQLMEDGFLLVNDEGEISIETQVIEVLKGKINDIERELTTNNFTTH